MCTRSIFFWKKLDISKLLVHLVAELVSEFLDGRGFKSMLM
jgi:hypothetical protein